VWNVRILGFALTIGLEQVMKGIMINNGKCLNKMSVDNTDVELITNLIGLNDEMDDLLFELILGPSRCLGNSLREIHDRCLSL
jgi:hypothetical protein